MEDDEEATLSDFEDDDAAPVVLPTPNKADDELRKELDEVRRQREEAIESRDGLRKLLTEALEAKEQACKQRDEVLKQVEAVSKQKEEASKSREQSRSEIEAAARILVAGAEKLSSLMGDGKIFNGGLPRSSKYTGLAAIAHGFCKRAEEVVEEVLKQREAAIKSRNESRSQMEQRNYQIAIEVSQLEASVAQTKEQLEMRTQELQKVVKEKTSLELKLEESADAWKGKSESMEERARSLEAAYDKVKEMLVADFKGYLATEESFINFCHKVDGKAVKSMAALPFSDFSDVEKVHQEYQRRLGFMSELLVHVENSWADREEARQKERLQLERTIQGLAEREKDAAAQLKSTLESRKEMDAESKVEEDIMKLAAVMDAEVRSLRFRILDLEKQLEDGRFEIEKLKNLTMLQTKDLATKAARIHELEEKDGITSENVEGLAAEIAAAEEELARWKAAATEEAAAGVAILEEVEKCNQEIASLNQLVIQLKQSLEEATNKLVSKEEMAAAAMAARDAAERSLRVADERATDLRERLDEISRQLEAAEAELESSRVCGGRFLQLFPWLREKLISHRASLREATNHVSAEMEELMEPLVYD